MFGINSYSFCFTFVTFHFFFLPSLSLSLFLYVLRACFGCNLFHERAGFLFSWAVI